MIAQNGRCVDGIGLAARLMQNLRIDFSKIPTTRFSQSDKNNLLGVNVRLSSTQPITPVNDMHFEWEKPQHNFASQPTERAEELEMGIDSQILWANLADDPTMSQFAPQPHLSQSLVRLTSLLHITGFRDKFADNDRPSVQGSSMIYARCNVLHAFTRHTRCNSSSQSWPAHCTVWVLPHRRWSIPPCQTVEKNGSPLRQKIDGGVHFVGKLLFNNWPLICSRSPFRRMSETRSNGGDSSRTLLYWQKKRFIPDSRLF